MTEVTKASPPSEAAMISVHKVTHLWKDLVQHVHFPFTSQTIKSLFSRCSCLHHSKTQADWRALGSVNNRASIAHKRSDAIPVAHKQMPEAGTIPEGGQYPPLLFCSSFGTLPVTHSFQSSSSFIQLCSKIGVLPGALVPSKAHNSQACLQFQHLSLLPLFGRQIPGQNITILKYPNAFMSSMKVWVCA